MARKYNTPYTIRAIRLAVLGMAIMAIGMLCKPATEKWLDSANGPIAQLWAWATAIMPILLIFVGWALVALPVINTLIMYIKYKTSSAPAFVRDRRHHSVGQPANRYDDVPRNPQAVVDSPRWS